MRYTIYYILHVVDHIQHTAFHAIRKTIPHGTISLRAEPNANTRAIVTINVIADTETKTTSHVNVHTTINTDADMHTDTAANLDPTTKTYVKPTGDTNTNCYSTSLYTMPPIQGHVIPDQPMPHHMTPRHSIESHSIAQASLG